MSFLNPAALWAFSLLIPLAAIYFLKVRPEKKYTSTLFLWEKIFKEKQTSALFKRLRDLLSLLLLFLAFSAIILAMAKPVFVSKDSMKNLVLVIDTSPSMNAAPGSGKTRLALAKDTAKNIIRNLSSEQKVTLASVNDSLNIIINATSNPKLLIEGIDQVQGSEIPLDISTLNALAKNKDFLKNSRFIVLSDGCSENIDNLNKVYEVIRIGEPLENVGISAFDLQKLPGETGTLGLYFQLTSSYKKEQNIDVMLCHGSKDNIIKVCPVKAKPGINKAELFNINSNSAGKWLLFTDVNDSLKTDNSVFAVLPENQPIKVAISNPQNSVFYGQCVNAFGNSTDQLLLVDQNPDIVICEGNPKLIKGVNNYIIINPTGKSAFWKKIGDLVESTMPKLLHPNHDAIKYAPIESVIFDGAKKIEATETSVILADNGQGTPLIVKATAGDKCAYIINMDPSKSEFFLSINFPVLLYSMALEQSNRKSNYKVTYRTGETIPQPEALKKDQATTLTTPAMKQRPYDPTDKTQFEEVGFYALHNASKTYDYACSLLSQADSNLNNTEFKDSSKPIEKGIPLSRSLLILALLIIAAECALYHQRKVG